MKISRYTQEINTAACSADEDGSAGTTSHQPEAALRALTLANSYSQCHCTATAHVTWHHMLSESVGGNATTKIAEISSFKKASRIYAIKKMSRRYFVKKMTRSLRNASCKTSLSCHTVKRMWRSDFFGKSPCRDTFKKFIAALCSEEVMTDHHRTFELKGVMNEVKTANDSGPNGLFLSVESGKIAETCVEVKMLIERVDSFCVGGINGETGGTGFLLFSGFVRTNRNVIINLRWESLEQLCLQVFASR